MCVCALITSQTFIVASGILNLHACFTRICFFFLAPFIYSLYKNISDSGFLSFSLSGEGRYNHFKSFIIRIVNVFIELEMAALKSWYLLVYLSLAVSHEKTVMQKHDAFLPISR